jgi:septal ring factor EnvC (AmiA/AmiB activator)
VRTRPRTQDPSPKIRLGSWVLGLGTALLFAASASAQTQRASPEQIRQQREELDRIRKERADLEARARQLKSAVRDLSVERENLDREADATARMVKGLDAQILSLLDEESDATSRLVATQDELVVKQAILRYRVREIYKRGGLFQLEALLSANSFGDLLARYKYLHMIALRDRVLVERVSTLNDQIGTQRLNLVKLRDDAESSRQEKQREERRLRLLEQQRGRSLAQAEAQSRQVEARLAQVARDEANLANLLSTLDNARRREEARPGAAPAPTSTLRTSDLGRLDWPVEGTILYPFGRLVNPNNTTIRWNGIGIGAPLGTPVKAIAAGTVDYSATFGTYGIMVMINHGGGDFSLYASLERAMVGKGARVTKGQQIGTVGVSDPEIAPHLHFEVRRNGPAVDPADWLRRQR